MQSSGVAEEVELATVSEQAVEIIAELKAYGGLIVDSLYLMVVSVLIIFVVHKVSARFLFSRVQNGRFLKVVFGTFYVLIVAMAALIALRRNGFEVQVLSQFAFLVILIGAVVAFFLVPFFPRLPLTLGQLVEVNGVLGTVDGISTFHTTLRKLDGTMAFIPNPLVLASRIMNFHDTPTRRIELNLSVNTGSDLEASQAAVLDIMRGHDRVLDEPASPAVYVVKVTAAGTDLTAFCWVKNADWFRARSDLWLSIVQVFNGDERLGLSLPRQEVLIIEDTERAQTEGLDT